METFKKYPRTYHFPFSPGATNDDKIQNDFSYLTGQKVVCTEKMDGENTNMTRDKIWARSLDWTNHSSRGMVKTLYENIRHEIPVGWKICGENLYVKHSIHYDNLSSFFMVFSIWNEMGECLSWEETQNWCELLGLTLVPVLWEGIFDYKFFETFYSTLNLEIQEGFVVRNSNTFIWNDFSKNVVKWVRKNHVQTSEHWLRQTLVKNKLSQG